MPKTWKYRNKPWSVKEIATATGLNPSTVRSRLVRDSYGVDRVFAESVVPLEERGRRGAKRSPWGGKGLKT